MCGIVGQASQEPGASTAWLDAANDALRHRGPDGGKLWQSSDARVALGHRRLAIIDLSPAASQPMQRGPLCIVFNGEIYNFADLRRELQSRGAVFHTHSDTEVILAAFEAWGIDCVQRLNGMFAFALHDAQRQMLYLARDRAGEKPLFYSHEPGSLRFASELKALMADRSRPRRIDPAALDCYLGMGFVPGERCILAGYAKLPPAHVLAYDMGSGATRKWRYWTLPPAEESQPESAALLDELEALLADAVRRQLVADVPVGIMLSGGVDSSVVTALACRARNEVKTFTVSFPGAGRHDESAHARLIARHFRTEHTEIIAEATSVDLLPLLARQYDEPLIDSSMIPTYLVSRQIRQHCTVALGGDGGDELFGGYSHYDRLLRLQRRTRSVPLPVLRAVAAASSAWLPTGTKGRNWLQAMGTDLRHEVPLMASYFDRGERQRLLGARCADSDVSLQEVRRHMARDGDLLQRATRTDFATYLPEDILVKVDRASMLSSLEVRAPLLDHRVVEFAFGRVPSSMKTTASGRKLLLKRLAQRLLPPEFDHQRKQGFSIPLTDWLAGQSWNDFFRATLLDGPAASFERREVGRLLDGQSSGRNNGERLFGLTMFELWRRAYGIEL